MIADRDGFLVRRLNQIWSGLLQRRFREAGYNITSVQFAALEMITQCKGLDQTDLSLRLGYDRATTGGMILRLQRDGYVERVPNPKDKRARLVTATEKGRIAIGALSKIARTTDNALLASLSTEDKTMLFDQMRSLVDHAEKFDAAPPFRAVGRSTQHGADD